VSRSDRILVAAGGAAVILALAAILVLLLPANDGLAASEGEPALLLGTPAPSVAAAAPSATVTGSIWVDVEGAVAQPGIRELPAGSRVADAITAAGGYATDADLAASATAINLAQPLTDGEQIRVPRIGEDAAAAASPPPAAGGTEPAGGAGGGGGLVNLNTATPEQLEALPGIGAVTVQKIVAARQERPFASLEEAVERGVIHRGQLEDIQGLATAG
jgi:competence protein ComEA